MEPFVYKYYVLLVDQEGNTVGAKFARSFDYAEALIPYMMSEQYAKGKGTTQAKLRTYAAEIYELGVGGDVLRRVLYPGP